jgi:hypothetical protein
MMLASSPAEVTPRVRPSISCKSYDCTFFTAGGRLKEFLNSQDYWIKNGLPALNQLRTGNVHHKVTPTLMVPIDNSKCRNGATVTEKMPSKGLGRASHPAYSSDISRVTSGHSEQFKE